MFIKNYVFKAHWLMLCLVLLLALPTASMAQQAEESNDSSEELTEDPISISPLTTLTCNTVYVNSHNRLYTVDTSTATANAIGTIGASSVFDIAFSGDTLYGIRSHQLFEIDPLTGAAEPLIGSIGGFVNALAAAPDGTLYAAGGQSLYEVDPNTGAGTRVGTFGVGFSSGDLVFANDGTLYAALSAGLAEVNVSTGAAALIGGGGFGSVWGLAWQAGQLYGFTSNGNVLSINTATGATTSVGNMGVGAFGATTYTGSCESIQGEIYIDPANTITPIGNTDTVAVAVGLDNVLTQVGATTIDIEYDPSVVTVASCNMVATGTCNSDYANNIIRITVAEANGLGNSTIANIDFNIVGDRGDVSPLDITVINAFDIYGSAIGLTNVDGSIEIPSIQLGDVNCDDEVNVVDALFILQFDAAVRSSSNSCPQSIGGTLPYSLTLYNPACDVNGDGYCNVVDSLFILQCDAGISNAFCPSVSTTKTRLAKVSPRMLSSTSWVKVSSDAVVDGEATLVLSAEIADNVQVGAGSFTLTYPAQDVQAINCETTGTIICNKAFEQDGAGSDAIRLTFASPTPLSGDIELATVIFEQVSAESFGEATIDVSVDTFVDSSGNPLPVETAAGVAAWGTSGVTLPTISGETIPSPIILNLTLVMLCLLIVAALTVRRITQQS